MKVYLVPVQPAGRKGTPEFAMYCEPGPEAVDPEVVGEDMPKRGLFARLARSFRDALAEGEAERRRQEAGQPDTAGGGKFSRLLKKKLADSVAEHRLLWALRHQTSAQLVHPDVVSADRVLAWARGEFKRDFNKHLFWCVVDGVLVAASAVIAPIPGPNLIAYYLIFRLVSHYLSLVGARRGLRADLWTTEPSRALTTIGAALTLAPADRDAKVDEAARALGLERLTTFVSRVTPGRS
ncbi:MAG: hypothetical protein O2917_09805 [Acidobacteria bacterium]|nr:hypothetical protein [Acidobacteriota bacterium]